MNPIQFEKFRKTPQFNKQLYDLGRVAEVEIFDKLKTFFDDDTIFQLPEGNQFDYEGINKKIELKSRRIYRLTYADTAIGIKKIETALKDKTRDYYFVFKFVNGLYYWKFDYSIQLRMGMLNNILHYFIPVNILIKID